MTRAVATLRVHAHCAPGASIRHETDPAPSQRLSQCPGSNQIKINENKTTICSLGGSNATKKNVSLVFVATAGELGRRYRDSATAMYAIAVLFFFMDMIRVFVHVFIY